MHVGPFEQKRLDDGLRELVLSVFAGSFFLHSISLGTAVSTTSAYNISKYFGHYLTKAFIFKRSSSVGSFLTKEAEELKGVSFCTVK